MRRKIYALIITATLFLSMNGMTKAAENENLKAENAMAKYAVEFLSKLKNKMGSKFESFKRTFN